MKHPRILALMTFAVLIGAGLWSTALGQSSDGNLANLVSGGSSVKFDVLAQNGGASLTVTAPDGRSFTKEFRPGTSPGFDFNEKSLPDGSYTYELRLSPSLTAGQKEAMMKARGNDDDPEAERAARKRPVLPNLTQSGAFAVINGQVVVAGLSENPRTGKSEAKPANDNVTAKTAVQPATGSAAPSSNTATRLRNHRAALLSNLMFDIVQADDVIIQGSLCVGFDCINNESFGFDTIRLKENNTRIKFEDTSVGAFPSNDWQLTANDSASGGANKFSIEDITGSRVPFTITAGAPTNSIFVDSTGRLGLRTATPLLDIHATNSNTPALRLEQNNSGGFNAQTWDVGGNEANFFVRDVTGGSRLPFRIRPGAPTSSLDISSSGNVGIGTTGPNTALEVNGVIRQGIANGISLGSDAGRNRIVGSASQPEFQFINTSNALANLGSRALSVGLTFGGTAAPTNGAIIEGNVGIATNAPTANLSVNGTANKPGGGSWDVFSDERLKNIKGQFKPGLSAVMRLQPLRYRYRENNPVGLTSNKDYVGFGAQALQEVLPEAVTRNENGYLQVNNDPIIWTMLNAIKEQQKEIEQLKGQIRKLQATSPRRRR